MTKSGLQTPLRHLSTGVPATLCDSSNTDHKWDNIRASDSRTTLGYCIQLAEAILCIVITLRNSTESDCDKISTSDIITDTWVLHTVYGETESDCVEISVQTPLRHLSTVYGIYGVSYYSSSASINNTVSSLPYVTGSDCDEISASDTITILSRVLYAVYGVPLILSPSPQLAEATLLNITHCIRYMEFLVISSDVTSWSNTVSRHFWT